MANEKIKGLTVKIGGDTTELNKALESVNKKSRSLSSELGQINRQLKFDPTNTELLAQKQKVLAEAIENTQSRLDTLREVEKQVQEQFKKGEIAEEQYRAFRREVMDAEKKLKNYKEAAEQTAQAVDQLGDKADKSAKEIQEQEEKAEAAEQAINEMGDTAATVAKTGLGVLAASATALVGTLVAVTEESREYRTEMGKLTTAFSDSSKSAEAAYETYAELQGIVGETDQAVEASAHLAELCDTEKDLNEWTDILTGAYAKFGASLPIENLAEAANESAKTGELVGGLADALNWAAEESETFGVTLKEATEENEEWNQAVEDAVKAEDYFALALQECNDEQERQQLITKTLTKLYKSAATQYKKTNKEVIESNKATEKWNKSLSKIGKTVDPVITDFKELGAEILDSAAEPIEDVTEFISKKFIPALRSAGNWIRENKAPITGTLTAVTVGLVAYKAAVLASEMQSKGLTVATLAQTAAQKAMNLAMAATPTGLLITAFAALAAGMTAYYHSTDAASVSVDVLTDAEKELVKAADEAAESFKESKEYYNEVAEGIMAETDHTKDLVSELNTLADTTGKVNGADQARVQFILDELNEALGTEYNMVDGIIQQYDELQGSIYEVINAKTANALIEAANADYITAIQEEAKAAERMALAEKEWQAQMDASAEKRQSYADKIDEIDRQLAEASERRDTRLSQSTALQRAKLEEALKAEEDAIAEKKQAYDDAAEDYYGYVRTISNYEDAQIAVVEGNTQKAIDLLTEKGEGYNAFANDVDEATSKVLDTLYKEAIQAGAKARLTKENFEKGVDGYTQDMVDEAEQAYADAMGAFDNAYNEAYAIGEDFGGGIAVGITSKSPSIVQAAGNAIANAIAAARKEADINSPSKKMIALGEDMGEGTEIGLDNKTPDVGKAAGRQMDAIMDAYDQRGKTQRAMTAVTERQAAMQAKVFQSAVPDNTELLTKILTALEKGQVLTLNGKALVGGTVDEYDKELGYRRELVARGAL